MYLILFRRPHRVVAMYLFLPVLSETKEILMKKTDEDLGAGRRSGRDKNMLVYRTSGKC